MSKRVKKLSSNPGHYWDRVWKRVSDSRLGRGVVWVYAHVKEPKVISLLSWLGYVALLGVGAYSLLDPPTTIIAAMGPYAMAVTSSLVTAGALFGAASSLQGWRFLERLGIVMTVAGSSIYLLLLMIMQFTDSGNRSFQAGFIFFVIVSLVSRWVRIRDGVFEPGSAASKRAQALHPRIASTTGPVPVIKDDR